MKEVSIIGVDLAKNVFQLQGAAADGTVWSSPGLVDGYGLTGVSASRACLSNSTGDL
jgi:hypothetical protein